MNTVIETLGLTKSYRSVTGRVTAVDALDLRVPSGGLHALLGPAKSGKSTVLRLLLGLSVADAGAARVLGVQVPDVGRELAGRVGAVVGEPGFLDRLSGRRNLLMHPATTNKAQVDAVLKQVGLTNLARETVGSYPPGARRRLAIAAGLLADPALLVLDDATGGLDAAGAREVRTLLRKLADRGPTVLLATDRLVEAQQIADGVTVLGAGKALASGPVADVIGEVATAVWLRVDDADRAVTELRAARFTARRDGHAVLVDGVAEPAEVTKALARKKLYVTEMSTQRESLSSLVRRLTPEPEPEPDRPTRAEQRAARKEAARKEARRQAAAKEAAARKQAAKKEAAEAEAAEKKAKEVAEATTTKPATTKSITAKGSSEKGPSEKGTRAKAAVEQAPAEKVDRKATAKGAKGATAKAVVTVGDEAASSTAVVAKGASVKTASARKRIAVRKEGVTPKEVAPTDAPSTPVGRKEAATGGTTTTTAAEKPVAKRSAAKDADSREAEPPDDTGEADTEERSWRERRRAAFEEKVSQRQAAYDARVAERDRAAAEKAAAKQARQDEKQARQDDRELARLLKAERKQAEREDRELARLLRNEERATERQEKKGSRRARAKALLGARAASTSGGSGPAGPRASDVDPDADRPASPSDVDPSDTDLSDTDLSDVDATDAEPTDAELDAIEDETAVETADDTPPAADRGRRRKREEKA